VNAAKAAVPSLHDSGVPCFPIEDDAIVNYLASKYLIWTQAASQLVTRLIWATSRGRA
jgi:hypothetical protein